jgi:phosphatidylglycerophosphatase A
MKPIAQILGTWFGCGLSPFAPGTVGSLGGIAAAFLFLHLTGGGPLLLIPLTLIFTWPAIWAAGICEQSAGKEDPGRVVIDEVLGQWLALAGLSTFDWKWVLAAFLLFRLFDILKPLGIRRLESYHGGVGIVADDLAAGALAGVLLFVFGQLGFLWEKIL